MKEPDDTDTVAGLLANIRPAAPSSRLMERLIAAMPVVPAMVEQPKRLLFVPRLAAAAAVMAVGGIGVWYSFPHTGSLEMASGPGAEPGPASTESPRSGVKHIRQQLLGMRDLGITRDAQSRPVRLMHARWLDQETSSENSGAGAAPPATVRDEIVPVVLTTY